jgi:Collagenase NC10 and Endostatin
MKLKYLIAAAAFLSVGASAMAQQAGQAPDTTFFVASAGSGKGGDLGGIEGADAQCQRLAQSIGAGNKTWRAYLSNTPNPAQKQAAVNARDRIGKGPWKNSKGTVVATSVDDLHSDNNKLGKDNSLTERGTIVSGSGMNPNWHDVLTGSQADGRAFPSNMSLTCNNWTSSVTGYVAMLGHIDRIGNNPEFGKSWNSTHMSRGCSPTDLNSTGGNGLFYCFAAD